VVTLRLPTLRERAGDIELLAEYFLARFSSQMNATSRNHPGAIRPAPGSPLAGQRKELSNSLQKALIYNRGTPISAEVISQAFSSTTALPPGFRARSEQAIRQWFGTV